MKKKGQESLIKIVIIGLVLVVGYLGYQSMTSGSSPFSEASEPTVPGRYGDISNEEEARLYYTEEFIEKIWPMPSNEMLIKEKEKEIEITKRQIETMEAIAKKTIAIEESKKAIEKLEGYLTDPDSDYWVEEQRRKNQEIREDINKLGVNAEEMRRVGEKLTPEIVRELEAMMVRIVGDRDFLDDKSVRERNWIEEILEAHDKITGTLDWREQRRRWSLIEKMDSIPPHEMLIKLKKGEIDKKLREIEEAKRHIEAIEAILIKTLEIEAIIKEIKDLKDYEQQLEEHEKDLLTK